MTAFARVLGEKAERYIELRHSLGYAFSKQAGTLRALVRYVERAQFDGPPLERWRWISPCRSAAPPTAASLVTACCAGFTSISPSMTREPKPWSAELSPDPERFRLRESSARPSWHHSSTHAAASRRESFSRGGQWPR